MNFTKLIIDPPERPGFVLRHITGWSFIVTALGVFMDEILSKNSSNGSIGLIPLYLGFFIGSICFVIYTKKVAGWIPALLTLSGTISMWYFMGSYPDGAEGWIGAILIGMAHMFLPLSGRLVAVIWIEAGILGFPEFYARPWTSPIGQINAFTLFGTATLLTGFFVVLSLQSEEKPSLSTDN